MVKKSKYRASKTRRAARLKANLSEGQAARIAGVMLSTFQRYERGARVPYHRALSLSAAYGCPIEVFLKHSYLKL
jgi:transcriptional regulator with XRE-family HTH domain